MITVCLYGGLRRFGRRFVLRARSPAEAVRALSVQLDGFAADLRRGSWHIRFDGRDCSEEDVRTRFADDGTGVLHIVPVVAGSGRAAMAVAGVVIAAAGYFTGQPWAVQMGVGMALGGVAQMLTRPPAMTPSNGADKGRNSSFSNLTNSAAQGQVVPLAYGRVYCGSRIVSQGVESRRLPADGVERTLSNSAPPLIAALAKAGLSGLSGGASAAFNPIASDLIFGIQKTFVRGQAATAPNGETYQTDFDDDSVRAVNYIAKYAPEVKGRRENGR